MTRLLDSPRRWRQTYYKLLCEAATHLITISELRVWLHYETSRVPVVNATPFIMRTDCSTEQIQLNSASRQ